MAESAARARLRDAALELFGRHGIQATSTRAILEAAGMRNPSAISYHFGSKAGLVDDLVTEVVAKAWPLVQMQAALAEDASPAVEEWAALGADSGSKLLADERGCLLARIMWEYDFVLHPTAFEDFLASGHPAAIKWLHAVEVTFTHLPVAVAVGRNLVMIRMLEWVIAQRASRLLAAQPAPGAASKVARPAALRTALYELSLALLSAPTTLVADDLIVD